MSDFEIDDCPLGVFTMGEEFEPHETGFVLNMLIDTYPNVNQCALTLASCFRQNEGPRHVLVMLFPFLINRREKWPDDDAAVYSYRVGQPRQIKLITAQRGVFFTLCDHIMAYTVGKLRHQVQPLIRINYPHYGPLRGCEGHRGVPSTLTVF